MHAALNADKREQGAKYSQAKHKMTNADELFHRSTVKGTVNKKPWNEKNATRLYLIGGASGTRTLDPWIKSP
jgi:hypothetical protein